MKLSIMFAAGAVALIATAATVSLRAANSKAELKVGLGIEKMELTGEATTFTVAPDTRIYAWTRVSGLEGPVTLAFRKDGKTVFEKKLDVPHSPYRTHAFRTFRAGDGGTWQAAALGPDGKELAVAEFTVALQ